MPMSTLLISPKHAGADKSQCAMGSDAAPGSVPCPFVIAPTTAIRALKGLFYISRLLTAFVFTITCINQSNTIHHININSKSCIDREMWGRCQWFTRFAPRTSTLSQYTLITHANQACDISHIPGTL